MARGKASLEEAGALADGLSRRPLQPFDDPKPEDFARARSRGETLAASARAAGVGAAQAKTWEMSPEVRERVRELRAGQETGHTVSVAWIVNELQRNAQEAREADPPQLKSSNEALKLLYEIVTKDKGMLGDIGQALPRVAQDLRAELTKRLSSPTSNPLDALALEAEGEEVH